MASAGDETEGKKKGADDDIYDELPTDFKIDDAANSGREIVEFEFIPASGERGKFVKKEKSVSQDNNKKKRPARKLSAAKMADLKRDRTFALRLIAELTKDWPVPVRNHMLHMYLDEVKLYTQGECTVPRMPVVHCMTPQIRKTGVGIYSTRHNRLLYITPDEIEVMRSQCPAESLFPDGSFVLATFGGATNETFFFI